jgi:hypothetical protein
MVDDAYALMVRLCEVYVNTDAAAPDAAAS